MAEAPYKAVHGAMYLDRVWHPTKQPVDQQDRWIQAGEVISLWQAIDENNWVQWHIDNPTIIRIRFLDVNLAEVEYLIAGYHIPQEDVSLGPIVMAKRLWQFDQPDIESEKVTEFGRAINRSTDILTFTKVWITANLKRKAEGGKLFNKAIEDIPLINPDRNKVRGVRL
jgi:hypothetical protein